MTYKIIIPKEESTFYTKKCKCMIFEPNCFTGMCKNCGGLPKEEPKTNLEKLPFLELVKEFAEYYKNIPLVEEPKQETLEDMKKEQTIEQASEYYAHNYFDMHETNNYQALKQGFINGAKWQQEQNKNLYSEEDLREAFRQGEQNINYSETYGLDSELTEQQWFEQFKKK